jgi:hypothetical protein
MQSLHMWLTMLGRHRLAMDSSSTRMNKHLKSNESSYKRGEQQWVCA